MRHASSWYVRYINISSSIDLPTPVNYTSPLHGALPTTVIVSNAVLNVGSDSAISMGDRRILENAGTVKWGGAGGCSSGTVGGRRSWAAGSIEAGRGECFERGGGRGKVDDGRMLRNRSGT